MCPRPKAAPLNKPQNLKIEALKSVKVPDICNCCLIGHCMESIMKILRQRQSLLGIEVKCWIHVLLCFV